MKGRISFNENTCKGCSLCVDACPIHILKLDTSRVNVIGYTPAIIFKPDDCIACQNCVVMCPDSVITLERLDA